MSVMNPTAGDVHVNVPLTNFSQKWLQNANEFIALDAMPNAPVSKQSDLYYEFSRADFFRNQAQERADGTESRGASFKLATNPYFARVYALHKDVTDRQRANADNPVQLENSATQFVTQQLMLLREIRFQQTYMPAAAASGIWATEWTGVAGGPVSGNTTFSFFNDPAADPIVDIREAITSVHRATGKRPNRIAMGREAWDGLVDNDAVLARVTGGTTPSQPAIVMRALLAQLFEVDMIHVGGAVVNTGAETDDADINDGEANQFVIGDNMLIYHAPSGVALDQPTAGQQFSWTGFLGATTAGQRITRFRSQKTQADRIEGEMAFDYKLTSRDLGLYFHNCISP